MDIYNVEFYTIIGNVTYASKILKEYEGRKYVVKVIYNLIHINGKGNYRTRQETEFFCLLDPYRFYIFNKKKEKMLWKRDVRKKYGQMIAEDILEKVFLELKSN